MLKKRMFEIISKADEGDTLSRLFDGLIMSLIMLSVVSIVLESYNTIAIRYNKVFRVFEYVTVAIFTIEYCLRIWTADLLYPESKYPRLRYFRSFMVIVDLECVSKFKNPKQK